MQQPALHVQVRQPDKMTLAPWPELPFVKGWLQQTRQAWRVLTAGGDHAERYLQQAIDGARARTDLEFNQVLEELRCNIDAYLRADEKFAVSWWHGFRRVCRGT